MPVIPASYQGDVALGSTLRFCFNTTDVADTPIAFATATPTLAAYVNGGTTQLTAGLTLTQAFDGVVGLHLVTAVLTSGNGYAAASDLTFTLESAATVDGVVVLGKAVGAVSIQNRSVAAIGTDVAAIKAKTDNLPTDPADQSAVEAAITAAADALPTAAENADAVWDEAVDGAVTARQSLRLANSANAGKLSGAATTNVLIRDLADTKDRIDATVDEDGNRLSVTRDVS